MPPSNNAKISPYSLINGMSRSSSFSASVCIPKVPLKLNSFDAETRAAFAGRKPVALTKKQFLQNCMDYVGEKQKEFKVTIRPDKAAEIAAKEA